MDLRLKLTLRVRAHAIIDKGRSACRAVWLAPVEEVAVFELTLSELYFDIAISVKISANDTDVTSKMREHDVHRVQPSAIFSSRLPTKQSSMATGLCRKNGGASGAHGARADIYNVCIGWSVKKESGSGSG